MKKIMTISGSDSSAGAGIQADLKSVSSRGDFISTVIVAVVAENTMGLKSLALIDKELVRDQIEAIYEDMGFDAIKLGMLPSVDIIMTVADTLKKMDVRNVVFDPCMVNKSEDAFAEDDSIKVLVSEIFPIVDLICPNILEAKTITGMDIKTVDDMKEAAKKIHEMGVKNVLLKGGSHIEGAVDIFYDGKEFDTFYIRRIDSKNIWGSGDVLAAIIASNLAHGLEMKEAIADAKEYVTTAIEKAPGIGKGFGVLNFNHEIKTRY